MPRCKRCKTKFEQKYFLQKFCLQNDDCIKAFSEYAKLESQKKLKKEVKEKKAKLKNEILTLSDYLKLAQIVVNKYIRLRDSGANCISCDKPIIGVRHASHYIAAFAHANIRFHEDNIWVSCYKCNVMLSGNQLEYRKRLIKKIGVERLEWLENNAHVPKKYSIEELKEIIENYRKKIKELQKSIDI